ncbi:uncharacterized protein [Anolis sagrei]|uniref:uncharacterized protein n=1 Tax=Anolis sagrei TaxID=38937 RepID=UPI0035210648
MERFEEERKKEGGGGGRRRQIGMEDKYLTRDQKKKKKVKMEKMEGRMSAVSREKNGERFGKKEGERKRRGGEKGWRTSHCSGNTDFLQGRKDREDEDGGKEGKRDRDLGRKERTRKEEEGKEETIEMVKKMEMMVRMEGRASIVFKGKLERGLARKERAKEKEEEEEEKKMENKSLFKKH